ncbi:MAG TPA: FTR1 family protein [Candidatus Binataceae bacterium]|nr:FTR1 family protein [Candidatus Binataceae bacterium]
MTSTVLPYFLYASGILFREGLEALLVIIALVAAARQADQPKHIRSIYAGAWAAIAVSLGLAWAVQHVIGDNTSDTLEGFFQLLAAATLFYVSSWMTAKGQANRWNRFIADQISAAHQSRRAAWAFAATAFLAVMREGAETIVFFQALAAGATEPAEHRAVVFGVIAGAAVLTIAFLVLRRMTYVIPVGRIFTATSILLYALAVIFVGQGIASFQESGVLGATFVPAIATIPMLGLYPTVQTLAAQAVLLLLALAAVGRPMIRRLVATDASHRSQSIHPA